MRTIKFRGKTTDGEWVYGSMVDTTCEDVVLIIQHQMIGVVASNNVPRETIGQFTGLLDKNGKEIYEGDILHIPEDTFNAEINGIVKWDTDGFFVESLRSGCSSQLSWALKKDHATKHYVRPTEVIGNVFDNPELTKD